jgi:curved DNA-binding protein CbpA
MSDLLDAATDERFDPYATLGVTRAFDTRAILAAYRAQARRHHPDLTPGREAHHRMAHINAAWEILRDPDQRAAWDAAHAPEPSVPTSVLRPHVTTARVDPIYGACTWRQGRDGEGGAGPPPGRPSGSVLMFGRHLCWSIGEIARVDPGYLQWLADRPEGRPYRAEIEAALEPLLRRAPRPSAAPKSSRLRFW